MTTKTMHTISMERLLQIFTTLYILSLTGLNAQNTRASCNENGDCWDCEWCAKNCNDMEEERLTKSKSITIINNNNNMCSPTSPTPPTLACSLANGPCQTATQCCAGLECQLTGVPGGGRCCAPFNATCTLFTDCCSFICTTGRCACIPLNGACSIDQQCCFPALCLLSGPDPLRRCSLV